MERLDWLAFYQVKLQSISVNIRILQIGLLSLPKNIFFILFFYFQIWFFKSFCFFPFFFVFILIFIFSFYLISYPIISLYPVAGEWWEIFSSTHFLKSAMTKYLFFFFFLIPSWLVLTFQQPFAWYPAISLSSNWICS